MGSIFEVCYIQNRVIMNHVIKRLKCNCPYFSTKNLCCGYSTPHFFHQNVLWVLIRSMCFWGEIRKILIRYPVLTVALQRTWIRIQTTVHFKLRSSLNFVKSSMLNMIVIVHESLWKFLSFLYTCRKIDILYCLLYVLYKCFYHRDLLWSSPWENVLAIPWENSLLDINGQESPDISRYYGQHQMKKCLRTCTKCVDSDQPAHSNR